MKRVFLDIDEAEDTDSLSVAIPKYILLFQHLTDEFCYGDANVLLYPILEHVVLWYAMSYLFLRYTS